MQYGYVAIFVLLMLGIIGVPVPDELLLMYLGYDARRGRLSLEMGIPVAAAATICGITVSFLIGRWVGPPVMKRLHKYLRINQRHADRAARWMAKIGHWALVIGFFVPGMRHVTAVAAGAARLDWTRFAIFAYGGAVIWSAGFILAGYFLGQEAPAFVRWLHPYLRAIEIVILGAIVGAAIWYFMPRRRKA